MRVGIVQSSACAYRGRWDAAFYLGDKEDVEKIKKARRDFNKAKERLKRLRAEAHENRARIRAMEQRGEVVFLKKR